LKAYAGVAILFLTEHVTRRALDSSAKFVSFWCIIIVCLLSIAVLLPVCVGAQLVRQSRGTLLLKQTRPRKTGSPVEAPDDLSAPAGRLCWSLWITGRWPTLILRQLGVSLSW
jgi:hypothetical protein